MKKFFLHQAVMILPTILIVSLLSFAMIRLLPSDAVETYIMANHLKRNEETEQMVKEKFGLDRSLPEQYLIWCRDVLHLDFGTSYTNQRPVTELLAGALVNTVRLALAASVWILLLTPLLALTAARRPGGSADRISRIFCLTGTAIPSFVLGFFLIRFFCVRLKLLPVSGLQDWRSLILPSFTLSLGHVASYVKMLRNEMLEKRNSMSVFYAKARGIEEGRIFRTHILKNSLLPVVNTMGISVGRLIAGTVVVENVFSLPGLGQLITKGILSRDYPVIQGYILLVAIVFILANFVADLISALIDPRIRLGVH